MTCQKEEKECILVKYLIYTVLLQFWICSHLCNFSAKSVFTKFQKNGFFQVWLPSYSKWLLPSCDIWLNSGIVLDFVAQGQIGKSCKLNQRMYWMEEKKTENKRRKKRINIYISNIWLLDLIWKTNKKKNYDFV